jgi:hypothetical protein
VFDFVDLGIPANPFYSLANNSSPRWCYSIVLASPSSASSAGGPARSAAGRAALARARFIVQLTPYGPSSNRRDRRRDAEPRAARLAARYLIAYVGVALLVSLWVLPGWSPP